MTPNPSTTLSPQRVALQRRVRLRRTFGDRTSEELALAEFRLEVPRRSAWRSAWIVARPVAVCLLLFIAILGILTWSSQCLSPPSPAEGAEPARPGGRLGPETPWLFGLSAPRSFALQYGDVVRCESGWNPRAVNPISGCRGLFQVCRGYHLQRIERLGYTWDDMLEPEPNAAVAIYRDWRGWGAWASSRACHGH